jgi:hypothetical protein
VKSVIIHADGRSVDLASGITPEAYAELEATQGQGTQKKPLMFCGGCNGGVYVKHGHVQRDELFAAHYQRGDCLETLAITSPRMSDEHKRMQEYTVRAANDGLYDADTEVRTTRGTRVDVVVDGRIGFEVQLSGLTAGSAVRRTARSMSAGLEQVAWIGDRPSVPWIGKVPGYQWLDNGQFLEGMPAPQSVKCRGVYTFRAERLGAAWVPVLEPLAPIADDIVVRLAAGSVKPVTYGSVQLITTDGIALYEEMTGKSLPPFEGRAPARRLPAAQEIECHRPPAGPVSRSCDVALCGEPPRPYEDGKRWLCTGHAWQHYVFSKRTIQ